MKLILFLFINNGLKEFKAIKIQMAFVKTEAYAPCEYE